MSGTNTQFDEFLAQEVREAKGVAFPVKTGFLRRKLTKKADCFDIHPNPDDVFCDPKVGPDYEIISKYQMQYLYTRKHSPDYYTGDPIIVERIYPEGYRIINGHHRWAAAIRMGQEKIPIEIVNLMHEADVKKILENSTHEKRAAFDLDEVIFPEKDDIPLEQPLPFPWNRLYQQKVRLGVPALYHYLATKGYDIWLYSSRYYSADTIQNLFRKYHVEVAGVIAAMEKRRESSAGADKNLETLFRNKYRHTIHIDSNMVLQIFSGSGEFREYPLSGDPSSWSQEVLDVTETLEKDGREKP